MDDDRVYLRYLEGYKDNGQMSQFEPEYTEEELAEQEEQQQRAEVDAAESAEMRPRTTGTWWCVCGHCQTMATEEESYCCHEWDLLMNRDSPIENGQCFAEIGDFQGFLNPMILDAFFYVPKINWKKKPKPDGPNGQLSYK